MRFDAILNRLAYPRRNDHPWPRNRPPQPHPTVPMKRLLITLGLVLAASPLLRAEALTPAELSRAVDYLDKTRDGVLAATRSLSPAQLNFKPAPDRWSVAEVTEHLAATEGFLMNLVLTQVMTAPARAEATDVKAIDEFVLKAIPDRTTKLKAPEPLVPTNRFNTPADSLKQFTEGRAKTRAFLTETKELRDHALDSPLGRKLDAYQWVLFIAAHSDRHTKQMLEVKADPNFPKN